MSSFHTEEMNPQDILQIYTNQMRERGESMQEQ